MMRMGTMSITPRFSSSTTFFPTPPTRLEGDLNQNGFSSPFGVFAQEEFESDEFFFDALDVV
jgi:hypothetical protein